MEEEDFSPVIEQDRAKLFRQWYWREDWGAQRPRFSEKARGPVSKIYFHYNTKTPPCYGFEECCATIQGLQDEQIRKEMNDIAYNFLVTSGGNIYVGRGFGVQSSPHLRYAYGDRIDIAFVGEWTLDTLPYNMFKSGMKLVQVGLEQGYVKSEIEIEPIIPKKKIPKEEAQMQRFLNRENNRKKKKPKKKPGRRRFYGKGFIKQYKAI